MKNKAITIPVTAFGGSQPACPHTSLLLSEARQNYFRLGQKQGLGSCFSTQMGLISPVLLKCTFIYPVLSGEEKKGPRDKPGSSGVIDSPLGFSTQPAVAESPGGMTTRLGGLHGPHLPYAASFLKGRHKQSVMGFASHTPGFQTWPHHLGFLVPSASYTTNLSRYFLISKMETTLFTYLLGCCKNAMRCHVQYMSQGLASTVIK